MSPSDLTDEALAAIDARAEAATPGPWSAPKRGRLEPVVFFASGDAEDVIQGIAGNSPGRQIGLSPEDATFIAHAREDVPALVAEVRRLRRLIATMPPWRVSEAPTDEELRALRLRWSFGPEQYQGDADALIAAVLREREKVAALRTALDAVTHAHERDLLRLAQALGFTHEPPSDVDAMVAAVERLAGERNRAIAKVQQLARVITNEATTQDAVELLSAALLQDAASAPNCMEWRGDYNGRAFSISVQWADGQSPHALIDEARRERDAALAIIEGRTVAPNDHELEVHAARGGRWRTRYQVGDPALCRDGMEAPEAREVRERMRPLHVYTWWATEADGTPCAWPVVTP